MTSKPMKPHLLGTKGLLVLQGTYLGLAGISMPAGLSELVLTCLHLFQESLLAANQATSFWHRTHVQLLSTTHDPIEFLACWPRCVAVKCPTVSILTDSDGTSVSFAMISARAQLGFNLGVTIQHHHSYSKLCLECCCTIIDTVDGTLRCFSFEAKPSCSWFSRSCSTRPVPHSLSPPPPGLLTSPCIHCHSQARC